MVSRKSSSEGFLLFRKLIEWLDLRFFFLFYKIKVGRELVLIIVPYMEV